MAIPAVTALQMPFSGGIDEATRPELIEPGAAWIALINTRAEEGGSVTKRPAYTAVTAARLDASSRSAGSALLSLGERLCVIDGQTIDIYAPTAASNVTKDRVPECLATRIPLPWPNLGAVGFANCIYAGGYLVVAAWSTGATSITLFVVDAASYAVVSGPTTYTGLTSFTDGPQLAAVGSTVAVFYRTGAAELSGRAISLASASSINTGWGSAVVVASDFGGGEGFDAHGLSDRFAIAHGNTSGGASLLTIRTLNTALASIESTTVNTGSTSVAAVALAGTVTTLWIGYSRGTDIYVLGVAGNSLATVSATQALVVSLPSTFPNTIGISANGTSGRLIVTENVSGVTMARSFTTAAGATSVAGTTAQTWYNVNLLTRPWRIDGRDYASVFYGSDGSNPQSSHFVVDIEGTAALRPVANIAPRLATSTSDGATQQVAIISASKVALVQIVSRTGGLGIGQGRAVELVVLDYAATNRWQAAQFASCAYLAGGVSTYFDGHRVRETNFLLRPEIASATAGAGTGVTGTAIRYIAVPEKFDGNGNCEMGAPSDPSSSASPSNDSVDVVISTIPVTAQQDASSTDTENPIRFAVYRSGDNGALPYYRCGTVNNSTSAATVTFSDTNATVTSNAKLYRQPGLAGAAQPRACPPGLHHVVAYGDMLVGVGDDLVTLWCSGQHVIGEGVWFADLFQFPVTDGGQVTGLCVQDGSLYVFKRRAIFAMSGDAPADNGGSGGLGPPRRLAVDVGCIDSRSIVVTSLGIFFQSDRGLELLTRAQDVMWIGERIQDTLASYPIVSSAVLDTKNSLVRFTLAASESAGRVSGNGTDLVFDLTLKVWISTDRKLSDTAPVPAQSAAMIYYAGAWRYAWLRSNGIVYYENAATHLDDGSFVPMRADSPKLRVAGIQGNHKLHSVALLGERHTAHQARINVAYNDSSSWDDSEIWTNDELAALVREQLEVSTSKEQVMSVQVRLEDVSPGGELGTGRGATWVGLALNIGTNNTRQATTLLPASHRK